MSLVLVYIVVAVSEVSYIIHFGPEVIHRPLPCLISVLNNLRETLNINSQKAGGGGREASAIRGEERQGYYPNDS